jgi:hypothetical protein
MEAVRLRQPTAEVRKYKNLCKPDHFRLCPMSISGRRCRCRLPACITTMLNIYPRHEDLLGVTTVHESRHHQYGKDQLQIIKAPGCVHHAILPGR